MLKCAVAAIAAVSLQKVLAHHHRCRSATAAERRHADDDTLFNHVIDLV